ncbi:MAG: hypothetical protein J6O53_07750, partial [Eubacterium sp.]|nr:hypothetical protein [Eubacterium sp.]
VASIALMIGYFTTFTIFALNELLCFNRSVPESNAVMIEGIILSGLFATLAIVRHKENIGRLIRHEENKLTFHKSEDV